MLSIGISLVLWNPYKSCEIISPFTVLKEFHCWRQTHKSTTETELHCKQGGSLQSQICKPKGLEIDTLRLNNCLEDQSHKNNKLPNITTSLKRRNVSSVVFFDKLYKSLNLNAMNSSTQHI